jgi:low temperature requirement protein LtrA
MTWRGALAFVALFVAMWFSWVGFTLYANRFDTDDVVFRLAKLAATLAVAGCAAAATGVTG